uniref:Uncharacterized protein n=1 Tax=Avena sativa TaxID=4498 RepID=A0ACD5Y3C9_AVESA
MERRQVIATREAPPRQQLPPGFRFHPTDEELVLQYLRRKALARPLPAAVIPVVHAAALPDPWDLPGASEGEAAYFFSQRQARAGGRRRRAASGYWKATGKEKPVFLQLQGPSGSGNGKRLLVGVKSALAFHRGKGKAPLTRTDWVMHEYRLAATPSDSQSCEWVVCRISLKNNRARRPSAGDAGSETTAAVHWEDGAGDHHRPSSPSSSCVTDTCNASDHLDEISSSTIQ